MPLPLSSQISDSVISTSDRLCDYFQKLASQSKQVSDTYAEIYDAAGNIKSEFLDKICTVSSPLDCSGLPTDPTTTAPTTTPAPTTTSPPSLAYPDLYAFVNSYDGTNFSSEIRTFDGDEFDSTGVFGTPAASAALPDNKTVVASALHPGTGEVYVIYVDGTADFDLWLTLATVNPSTGGVTDIGSVETSTTRLKLDNTIPIISFRPSDNQLRLMSGPTYKLAGYAFNIDSTSGAAEADAAVGFPAALSGIAPYDLVTLSDGTPYVLGEFNGVFKVLSHSYAKHPVYPTYYDDQVAGGAFQISGIGWADLVLRAGSAFIMRRSANILITSGNLLLKAGVSSDRLLDPDLIPLTLVQQDAASMKEIHSLAYLPS